MEHSRLHPLYTCLAAFMALHCFNVQSQAAEPLARVNVQQLAKRLRVGDIVFIRVDILPFRKIAHDTGSWTNHVGIVTDISGAEPIIAESTFPVSRFTPFSKFVKRSQAGRVAVSRLNTPLTQTQQGALKLAALKRLGIFYDTGFNLHSHRQFCSRYVREVIAESTGMQIGDTENFTALFAKNPNADLVFWRIWYFGRIPWKRETVTPASLQRSKDIHVIF